jgi:hypothetical protein
MRHTPLPQSIIKISPLIFAMSIGCNSTQGTVGPEGSGGSTHNTSTTTLPAGNGGVGGSSNGITVPSGWGGSGAGGLSLGYGGAAGNCGSITSKAERVPADVLLVQDASGSMSWSIEEDCDCGFSLTGDSCFTLGTCVDRWSTLKTAVASAVTASNGIRWGLELFADPEDGDCAVAPQPQVPIGADTASAIQQELKAVRPGSNTPTAAAITVATAYLKTVSDGNKKAILLSTDGEPNCGGGSRRNNDDLPNTLTAIKEAAAAGFPVYVVGIGPSASNLGEMAQAGGTSKYYPATSPQQLSDALAQISKVVASCSYSLAAPPPDPTLVSVYVDKQLVNKDAANGWDFGATQATVVLHGSLCDAIMAGTAKLVEIVFGCPGVPPPDIIK